MVSAQEELSISKQCRLLDIPRSSFYHKPKAMTQEDLELMKLIDQCYLERPYYGSRRIKGWLFDHHQFVVNRKRIQRLMRQMGIETLYPKRNLSIANQQHKVYPYLLRGVTIDHPNQVWSTDITYIPMAKGFVYLVAVIAWYSRKVLSWRLSTTLDAEFCVEALKEALERYGKPDIFNTDQGCQFTSEEFTRTLKKRQIKISMDGKGRWVDNVFVERLWRTVKYEEVYLKAYENVADARQSLSTYFEFYNTERRHQALNGETPDNVYFESAAKMAA